MSVFQKATRKQVRLRMALDGPPGAGKTFTALRFATALTKHFGGRIAIINTESGAVEKYLGMAPDGIPFDFDMVTLEEFAPTSYTTAIQAAGREGYTVVIIDSLSHAWEGEGGALDQVDKKSEKNKFTAWKDVTPQHRGMIEAMLRSPCHVIGTMRTKVEHVLEEDERGKKVPRKVGMKPVQREGMEYEFDIVADLDELHLLKVSKSRCPEIDNLRVVKPGAAFLDPVIRWMTDGSDIDPSYFATTEADLKTLQDRDRRVAAQQPQKAVDFRKQLTGAPGAGAAPASSSVVTPSTSAAAPAVVGDAEGQAGGQQAGGQQTGGPENPEGPCSEGQATHIRTLFQQCEIPVERARDALAKRGAAAVKDLNYAAAEDLIDSLLAIHKRIVEDRRRQQDEDDAEAKRISEAKRLQGAGLSPKAPF